jgi:hypothetical protein
MPVPIPSQVLRTIKAKQGLSLDEKLWLLGACLGTVLAVGLMVMWRSPMPLVIVFAGWAIVVAQLDEEEFPTREDETADDPVARTISL